MSAENAAGHMGAIQSEAALPPREEPAWTGYVRMVLGTTGLFVALLAGTGRWFEAAVLLACGAVSAVAFFFGPRLGRDLTLDIVAGVLIAFLVSVVWDGTPARPAVVWFVVLPASVCAVGRARHVVMWGSLSIAGILLAGARALPGDPLWAHPLTAANLIGVVLASSIPIFVLHRQRQRSAARLQEAARQATEDEARRRQAEDRLRQDAAAKSRLLAAVSHDLRTPLIGVRLACDELDAPDPSAPAHDSLGGIQRSVEVMVQMLDGLLQLDESGPQAASVQVAAVLLETVEAVVSLVAYSAAEAKAAICVQVDPMMPGRWLLDEVRLKAILLNLLTNAVQHANAGRIDLTVAHNEDEQTLNFIVEDDGVGIPEGAEQDIFAPYTRLDASRRGAGLGLCIAQDFAAVIGGHIAVSRSASGGTRFTLSLSSRAVGSESATELARAPQPASGPVALRVPGGLATQRVEAWLSAWGISLKADARSVLDLREEACLPGSALQRVARLAQAVDEARGLTPAEAALSASSPSTSTSRARVVVADDDPTVVQVLAHILRNQNCEVQTALDGHEAVRCVVAGGVDLLLIDMHMPQCTGLDAARTIRKQLGAASPKIVLLSGSLLRDAEQRDVFDDLLHKPVARDALLSALQRALPHLGSA